MTSSSLPFVPAGSLRAPRGELRINWQHPAAKGLKHLFVCRGDGMRDLVTGKWYPATGGSRGLGALGEGWQSGGAGSRISGPSGAAAIEVGNYSLTPVTAIVAGKFSTSGNSSVPLGNCYYADRGGWVIKSEQYNNTGTVGWGSFGAGLDYNSGIPTPSTDGSVISLSLGPGAGASLARLRVNNSYAATDSGTPGNTGDTITVGAAVRYGGSYVDPLVSGDIVYWAAIYRRALNRDELALWHNGPYGVLVTQGMSPMLFVTAGESGGADLTGDASGNASASGALTVNVPITGGAVAVATAAGTIMISMPLGGAAVATATTDGDLTLSVSLAGAAVAEAVAAAGLSSMIDLAGAASGSTSAAGDLDIGGDLSGAAQGEASASATLSISVQLAGAAIARAIASGDLDIGGGLSGAAQGQASASGTLLMAVPLSGSAEATATAQGDLGQSIDLAGAAVAAGSAAGGLSVSVSLAGDAIAQALASGNIQLAIPLAGSALAQATASGALSTGGAYVPPPASRLALVWPESRMATVMPENRMMVA